MVGVLVIWVEAPESIIQGVEEDVRRACVLGDGGGSEARLVKNRAEVPLVQRSVSYLVEVNVT